jgi:CspA family cold shock protein
MMTRGRVRWFDHQRGFGSIEVEDAKDVFVQRSAILIGRIYKSVDKSLNVGDQVEFEMSSGPKGPSAANLKIVY